MKSYVDGLQSRIYSIEKAYSKFNHEDEETNFNAVIPSFNILLENGLDVWKCFHVLYPLSLLYLIIRNSLFNVMRLLINSL